ncbi:N-acylethanolamine-hydrolyzing acid amidase-like isoform X1 [Dunckerocampus dactyliophorus]|uniref:N-acylethanolamine-hydrolyzing acid amidase-like isoform X1 n=1 Tax=Dunckerocampus dactyliophorus TaxID=161453 RepID=UPI002405A1D1|nr:N-acylethanolamine-hydrolyzing acid amidase-like isoform X1 [Dunckerocampus dactyliophorus]
MMVVRAAALLLGLVVSCSSDFAPPTISINLDDPATARWEPILTVFDADYLKRAAAEVIDSSIPKWLHYVLKPLVKTSEMFILPEPYGEELRGLAAHFDGSLSDVIMLNFAYEVSAYCTSIVAQDTDGNLFHGRNLDYPHSPILRNLTINVDFLKDGKVAYSGTSFAGYVGLWTGQSPYKFTVSGDQRGKDHWWNFWKNVVSAFLLGRSPVSWLMRETLEEAENFQDAVMRLAKVPIITGVYYIVGGARAGEGVVITRDRASPADIWPLDPLNGQWFRVETNFDHWRPPPATDHRREAANKAMNATGQGFINMHTLYQVLSLNPVCNEITVYTTTMSAATPEEYTTFVRPQGCHGNL